MPGESRALVVHCGGPTAVLNASLAGIIEAWTEAGNSSVFGARFGVQGLVAGDWIDLSSASPEQVRALRTAPGSAIGSSRMKLSDVAAERLLVDLRRKRVDCLFYTGGNGSMGTAWMLAQLAQREYPALRVIGVPKTVDNDLMVTDHSPGFGSAARFYALSHARHRRGQPGPALSRNRRRDDRTQRGMGGRSNSVGPAGRRRRSHTSSIFRNAPRQSKRSVRTWRVKSSG